MPDPPPDAPIPDPAAGDPDAPPGAAASTDADHDPTLPHERPRRRRRAAARREATREHRTAITRRRAGLTLVGVAALALVLAFGLGRGAPETLPLGSGDAGVRGRADSTTAADTTDARPLGAGVASYYGDEFAGRPTASGEAFDPDRLTAAHRTLPLGSRLRVTNPSNGRSVVVRVNDRGPFHGNRVLDLSEGAARRIGLLQRGHGRVRLELLE